MKSILPLLVLLILIGAQTAAQQQPAKSPETPGIPKTPANPGNIELRQGLIPVIRDLAQTAFFIVVGIVTVLTYLRARKTILQPLRTEAFKEQISLFKDILRVIGRQFSDTGLWSARDRLVEVNILELLGTYAHVFFNLDLKEAKGAVASCPRIRVPVERVLKASPPSTPLPIFDILIVYVLSKRYRLGSRHLSPLRMRFYV